MAGERVQRRLAAIAVVDVVGYSRLMEADEAGTLDALKQRRKAIVEPIVRGRGGRIVKVMGDGVLIEFASAVNAVDAALDLQAKMVEANRSIADDRRILLRIGINLGDVIGDGSDIYGDGVNVAARLEPLAKPGGVCISAKVHEELRGKGDHSFVDLGEVDLKNIARPVRVYRVARLGTAGQNTARRSGPRDKTLDSSAALRQSEWRRQPAISFGWHHRRYHHGAVALQDAHRGGAPRLLPSGRAGRQSDAGGA